VTFTTSAFARVGSVFAGQTVASNGAVGINAPCPAERLSESPLLGGDGATATDPVLKFLKFNGMTI
jgi:hypothetical protein